MKIKTKDLLRDLRKRTLAANEVVLHLQKSLSETELNYKPDAETWSLLEITEHLCRYGDFYLPEAEKRLKAAAPRSAPDYKSGWLGEYFAQSMLPKNGKIVNKMNTFKSKNPNGSKIDKQVLDRFLQQQQRLLIILEQAENYDLSKIKSATTIGKLVKIKLGDALRVVVYHIERHILQMQQREQQIQSVV